MLVIRYQRTGRKNDATFRIIVTEKARAAKKSRVVEYVGSYHPKTKAITLNNERILYWMSVGAQPSDTLRNLLIEKKVLEGKKVNVLPKKTAPKKEEVAPAPEVSTPEVAVESPAV